MPVGGSNSSLLPFSLTSPETDVDGGGTTVDAGPPVRAARVFETAEARL